MTCEFGGRLWGEKDQKLVDHVVERLHENKVIKKEEVCFSKVERTKYAYVVSDLGYEENTEIFRDFFRGEGIELCGRFAEFEYLNMDATIERGIKTAEKVNAQSRLR